MATAAIAPAIATIHLRSSAFICGSFAFARLDSGSSPE
jgi:hypothetical protein